MYYHYDLARNYIHCFRKMFLVTKITSPESLFPFQHSSANMVAQYFQLFCTVLIHNNIYTNNNQLNRIETISFSKTSTNHKTVRIIELNYNSLSWAEGSLEILNISFFHTLILGFKKCFPHNLISVSQNWSTQNCEP